MNFLKEIKNKHPSKTLKYHLHESMAGDDKGRSCKILHASEVTKTSPEFCPRKHVLHCITDTKPKGLFVGTSLRYTFDLGNIIQQQLSDDWAADVAIGDWECLACGNMHVFTSKPFSCAKCKRTSLTYKEHRFISEKTSISCGIDLMVDLSKPKYDVVEIKTIEKDMHKKLQAPLAEHVIRTRLYLKSIAESNSPYVKMLNTDEASVLYISKGFGSKDEEPKTWGLKDSGYSPFKEFKVKRNDEAIKPYTDRAMQVHWFYEKGIIPQGVCNSPHATRAQQCEMAKECFSNHFPVGGKYNGD